MKQAEGEELDIYWLDLEDGTIIKALVYLRDTDQYICEAVLQPQSVRGELESTPADKEAFELMAKYKKTITSFMKGAQQEIDSIQVIGMPTKALNNGFKIKGLKPIQEANNTAETLPALPNIEDTEPTNYNDQNDYINQI
jgi:hypothetical protein